MVLIDTRDGLEAEDDLDDEGLDESDSDSGLGSSTVPPCTVIFIGANVSTGKSSMRSKPKERKVRNQIVPRYLMA